MRIVLKDAVSSVERDAMIAPLLAHNAAQGVDFTNSRWRTTAATLSAVFLATPDGVGYTSPLWLFQQSYAGKVGGAD